MDFIKPFVSAAREYWRECLVALAVFLAIVFIVGTARAEAPACMTPDKAQAEIAAQNNGVKPVAILEGEKARAFAAQAGRSGGNLVYLIYVHEGHVFIFEFADGCFQTQGGMPVEQFRLMFPGVLPEDK
jgi:hypothetical protein